MTSIIGAMDHADDSGGELGDTFHVLETAYLELLVEFLGQPFALEDLIELAVWEDYGLIRHVEAFLGTLPERFADGAVRHLARVIAELRREELDDQLGRATRLRDALLHSVTLLQEVGSE